MKFKLILLVLLLFSIIPMTLSTTIIPDSQINNTNITSTGLNLTISFQSQLCTGIIIETNSIYFENLRFCGSSNSLSFNITNERNTSYSSSQLPIFISNIAPSTGSQTATVSNGLTNSINVTGSFDSNNVFGGTNIKSFNINGNNNPFTSNNDSIFFDGLLTNGNNSLNVNYYLADNSPNGFCSNVTAGYSNFFTGIIVLFGILAIGIIILILYSVVRVVNGEELNFEFMDNVFENFPVKIVMLSLLGITILVWIIISIMGALCGL